MKKLLALVSLWASVAGAFPVSTNEIAVDVADYKTESFRIPQGEMRYLLFDFQQDGVDINLTNLTADLLYQGGSMTSWASITGAVVNTNQVLVPWGPDYDLGYSRYTAWLRLRDSSENPAYRLKVDLAMIKTPGFTPNATELTIVPIDFGTLTWTNEPWISTNDVDGVTIIYTNGQLVAIAAAAPDLVARQSIADHEADLANPHQVTAVQLGAAGTGTVAAIDSRVLLIEAWPTNQWDEAYGWGNHALAGYLTDFSTMTTNDITAAGGVVTNGTEYLLIKSQAAGALPATGTPDITITLGDDGFFRLAGTGQGIDLGGSATINQNGTIKWDGQSVISAEQMILCDLITGAIMFSWFHSPGTGDIPYINSDFRVKGSLVVDTNLTAATASVTGAATAGSFAYHSNRRATPSTTTIPTNATYTISSTGAFERVYGFAGTNAIDITLTGPGAGYRAEVDATFTNYNDRTITWTNSTPAPTFVPSAPTSDYSRVIIQWDGTNSTTVLNIAPGE